MPIQVFPFGGMSQSKDPRLTPDGVLIRSNNCEILTDGALRVRPGYQALPLSCYGLIASTFTPFDLVSYGEDLVAFGDALGYGFPTDLFMLLDAAAPFRWRPTVTNSVERPRLGGLTGARSLADVVDQEGPVTSFACAVAGNFLATVWSIESEGNTNGYFHVVEVDSGRTVYLDLMVSVSGVVSVESVPGETAFILAGVNSGDNSVRATKFSPLVDSQPNPSTVTVLSAGGNTIGALAMCQGDDDNVVVAASCSDSLVRAGKTDTVGFTTSFVSTTLDQPNAPISLASSGSGNWVVLASITTTGLRLDGFNLSAGTRAFYDDVVPTASANFTQVAIWSIGEEADVCATDDSGIAGTTPINRRLPIQPLISGTGTVEFSRSFRMTATPPNASTRSQIPYLGVAFELEASKGSEVLVSFHDVNEFMASEAAFGQRTEQTLVLPQIIRTATKLFWPRVPLNEDGFGAPLVTVFELENTARRQVQEFAGSLYIAGGQPSVYGGQVLVEQGFQQRPVIQNALPSNGAGALRPLGTYRYRMHLEWVDEGRRLHRSAPSDVFTVTMGASDNTVTLTASAPLSLRSNDGTQRYGSAVRMVYSRTPVFDNPDDPGQLLVGENFHRTGGVYVNSATGVGVQETFVDTRIDVSDPVDTDLDLTAQGVLYTQSDALGGDTGPGPADRIGISRDRLVLAKTHDGERWKVSKRLDTAAPIRWADDAFASLAGRVSGDIVACRQLGDVIVLFTRREVWAVSGVGPDPGGNGEYFPATRIPTDGGMDPDGWQSMVEVEKGLFFKLADGKLYLLDRALKMTWIGHHVVELLEQFPQITAAHYIRRNQSIHFAVRDAAGTDGGILRHDLRTTHWFFDPLGPIDAMAHHLGRVAYISAGQVFLQDEARGVGVVPTVEIASGASQLFQTVGWGLLEGVGFMGTFQGACRILLYIDFEDQRGEELAGEWVLSLGQYTVGDKVLLTEVPRLQTVDSFKLRLEMTPDPDSEGCRLHAWAVETEMAPGLSRQADSNRR